MIRTQTAAVLEATDNPTNADLAEGVEPGSGKKSKTALKKALAENLKKQSKFGRCMARVRNVPLARFLTRRIADRVNRMPCGPDVSTG